MNHWADGVLRSGRGQFCNGAVAELLQTSVEALHGGCDLRRMRFRFVISVVVALALLGGAARAEGSVRVTARFPSVAVAGSSAVVRGRGHGWRPGLRVGGQQRAVWARRWVWRGFARRVSGSLRFRLAWRAPRRPGIVRLRVVALAARGPVAASSARRVAVSATHVLSTARLSAAPP